MEFTRIDPSKFECMNTRLQVALQTDKAEDCTPKLSCINTARNETVTLNIDNQLHQVSPGMLLQPDLSREKQ